LWFRLDGLLGEKRQYTGPAYITLSAAGRLIAVEPYED
tara:strand:+ start:666 stop:779 length:114 start_codon:yes stop_codon:yes gene_type:complete